MINTLPASLPLNFPELNEFSYSVAVLLCTVLAKVVISHFYQHEPLAAFRFYCDKLAEKVNKPKNSSKQQSISGLVALVVTLTPLLIIIWLFEAFIEVKWLWQGLLFYVALGGVGLKPITKKIAVALTANQNYLAKQTLMALVLRDTRQLSSMGLSKTCIEMQLLRTVQQGFTVCFYFLVAGPLAAIAYRLLLEMHHSWNVKQTRFIHFGVCSQQLVNILQWLPTRLFTLLLLFGAIGQNFLLYWRLLHIHFLKLNNDILIHCLALNLGIKLAGVAMYDGVKVRRPSFNDQAKQPEPSDIIYAGRQIQQVLIACTICLVVLTVILENMA